MSSADTGHGTTQLVNVATARHVTCVLTVYMRITIQSFLYKLYSEVLRGPSVPNWEAAHFACASQPVHFSTEKAMETDYSC